MINCTENLSNLLKAIHQAAVKLESESGSSRAHALDLYPLPPGVRDPASRDPNGKLSWNMEEEHPGREQWGGQSLQPPEDAAQGQGRATGRFQLSLR